MKKRYLRLLLKVLLTGLIFGFCFVWAKQEVMSSVNLEQPIFILDAGHGGEDGGAVSCTGEKESTINLEITMRLDQILVLLGKDTLLLRDCDVSLHNDGAETLREKKNSDLKNRTATVNSNPFSTLVSIHQNSYSEPKYRGTQIFYAPTGDSKHLAETIQNTVKQILQPDNTRQAKLISENVYLMNHIKNRAVLVECGFLSNPEENILLQNPDYQRKFALVLGVALTQAEQ